MGNFTFSSLAYVKIDFKKVASDLSHADSTLVERECFKRKTKLSDWP